MLIAQTSKTEKQLLLNLLSPIAFTNIQLAFNARFGRYSEKYVVAILIKDTN